MHYFAQDDTRNAPPEQASRPETAGATFTSPRYRFALLATGFLVILAAIVVQTVRYQVLRRGDLPPEVQPVEPPAPRGVVVDRRGVPLVVNRHFFVLSASSDKIKTDADRAEVARQLNDLLGIPTDRTLAVLTDYPDLQYIPLADAISAEDSQRLHEFQDEQIANSDTIPPIAYVQTEPMTRRFYPQGNLTGQLTGFVSPDFGGVTGIEQYYDKFLMADGIGLLNAQPVAVSALPEEVRRYVPSTVGKDLVLTVDRTIQWILREELAKGLEEFKALQGSIIVLDPRTSAILGMVSLPDYDPNQYDQVKFELFSNPTISAQYEPGSVFKLITMAAALDTDLIRPSTIFTDTGSYTLGGRVFFNSLRNANGQVSTTEALALSLNVVTVQIAERLASERFYKYVRQFGFGQATQVDLSGEIAGSVKSPGNSEWSLADLGTNSFGQGLAVTPLQMVNSVAAIANGGKLMRPYVVEARVQGTDVQMAEPEPVMQVLKPESARLLTQMMVDAVEIGQSKAAVDGYVVAGKSGTAQIAADYGYEELDTIASYVGFVPAFDPKFVILVKLDRPDPTLNQWAGQTAAPVFSRVAQRLLEYSNIPPDDLQVAQAANGGE